MTNNTKYPPMLSVELRALLERVATEADHMLGFTYASNYDECRKAVDELRALLDKPDECRCKRYGKDNPHWPCPVHAEPAAQHQCEPVAELQVAFFEHGSMARINWFTPSAFESGATKLYAERPAPVAVVMPDSLNPDEGYSVEAASWYNLALDDVARLNGVKP